MIKTTPAQRCGDSHAELGEGPVWDSVNQRLLWVDIDASRVYWSNANGESHCHVNVPSPVSALALTRGDSLVVASAEGFGRLDLQSGGLELVAPVSRVGARGRMNDGKVDPRGRFWSGTVDVDGQVQPGALYRLDPDLCARRVLDDVMMSNGLGWSPDAGRFYFVDSLRQSIDAFDFDVDTGRLGRRAPFVTVPRDRGIPDGLAVDSDGCVWVAVWGSGAVWRYTPWGTLDRRVAVPVKAVTSCAFGGENLTTLFITTASASREPQAGGLFAAPAPARGFVSDRVNA